MIHPDLILALAHGRIEELRRDAGSRMHELDSASPLRQSAPLSAQKRSRPSTPCESAHYRRGRRLDAAARVNREVARS